MKRRTRITTLYGTPKRYPYYFKLYKKKDKQKKNPMMISGVFKRKKEAVKSAKHFSRKGYANYKLFKR